MQLNAHGGCSRVNANCQTTAANDDRGVLDVIGESDNIVITTIQLVVLVINMTFQLS